MRRRLAPLAALGLAVATACIEPEDLPPGETAAERCVAYVERGLAVDSLTRAALRTGLGPASEESVTTEPNRHIPDAIDSLFTLQWPGLTVNVRTPPAGNDLVERVTVTDDRWLRWTDPGIGDTEARLREILGTPQERQGNVLRYACGMGPVDQPVGFVIADGAIVRIVFDFYVD